MKISSRFTIAVHTMIAIEYFKGQFKSTSKFLANSVGVNPVVIREILGQLKKAGLVNVQAGTGGASLSKKPKNITLKDIFYAVESLDNEELFDFHENPNNECPVGKNIHKVLDKKLTNIQNAMNKELASTTLADLMKGVK
jgi:Rrf2 family protein